MPIPFLNWPAECGKLAPGLRDSFPAGFPAQTYKTLDHRSGLLELYGSDSPGLSNESNELL